MLLFAVIQLCMFMLLLFHPRVLGWILTQLWKIVTFGRKEALGEFSIKGIYIFSLTICGCTLNLPGVKLSIEWAGIRIKLREIPMSPCEVWFDGVSVIEVKDEKMKQQLPRCVPQRDEEDKPPPTHRDSLHKCPDNLIVLPGFVIWLFTAVRVAISHLVLEIGDHKVDVTHAEFSANFPRKSNSIVSVVSLEKVKFQNAAIGLYGTFEGFVFKSKAALRRHEQPVALQQRLSSFEMDDTDCAQESYSILAPMEITHVVSVSVLWTSLRARVVVRDDYPRLVHEPPTPSEISRFAATSLDEKPPLELLLSNFVPRLFSLSISGVQVFVSAEHGMVPNLCLSINPEPGCESARAVKGQWTLSVNEKEVEDGIQATPSAAVKFDLGSMSIQCNGDEALIFRKIHFTPLLNVHKIEGFNKFHVSPAVLKGKCDFVSGHMGQHLFSWIGLHERWEVITRLGKGMAQMERLDAGLSPLLFRKLPISYAINSVDVVIDEPKAVSSLYSIDTEGVPDEFQYHARGFGIEGGKEVVLNPETHDCVVEINVRAQKVLISLKKASEMSLDTYVTSANCELEIEVHQFSVKKCVTRKIDLAKAEAILNLCGKSFEFTERVHPVFERRICQTEDMEFQQHKILMLPGGKYGEGVRLAKPVVDIDVKMGTLDFEWSGRTHVSFFRLIHRFPLTTDNALGLPKDIRPSRLKQRITVSRRLMVQVVPASVSESIINGRPGSGYIELQVETPGLDFSLSSEISEPLDVALSPTLRICMNVNVDDIFVLVPPSHPLDVKRGEAVDINTSSLAAALAVDDSVNSVPSNHHHAALGEKEQQQQPNGFIPVLHMRAFKFSQEYFDTDVVLDSIGYEIAASRKTSVSMTFSSIDVTFPLEFEFGDIVEDISKQFQIAEALIPEREKRITAVASSSKFDFYHMTFICTDKRLHQDALAPGSRTNKLEEGNWEEAVYNSMVRKIQGGGILAMTLKQLEYYVDRDDPLDSVQARIRSLDSHDGADEMVYQNIQGGETRLMVSDYAAWVSGCSTPVIEFTSLCLTGVLLRASLSVGPYSYLSYQLRLSTPPDHPFQNYPCNSGTSIKLDTMPQKNYTDVMLEIDGLELLYGRCLKPAIDLAGKAFSRLQSHSNSRRKEASIALCSPVKPISSAASSSLSSSSPTQRSSLNTSRAPGLAAWDNLRCKVHGQMEVGISRSTFTYLLAPRSQAHNLNLFDSVRVISEGADFSYTLGHFSLNLIQWVVSIPRLSYEAATQDNKIARTWSNTSNTEGIGFSKPEASAPLQSSGEGLGDGKGVVPPKFTKKNVNVVYGPRHCAIFLPRVTIHIAVVWNCRLGKPFWHHFSSDFDEIRNAEVQQLEDLTQPHKELKNLHLFQSCDNFRATGICLDIDLDTSSVPPMNEIEAIWFAIRMDTLERLSLMDDYYDIIDSPSNLYKQSLRGENSAPRAVPATTEESNDDYDAVQSQPFVQSLNVKIVVQGLSMIAWRGVSRTSDGFLLSIQYFDSCGISIGRRGDVLGGYSLQPTYIEARTGGFTVDLVNVSSIFSDWEASFDSKMLVPCHQSSEEFNAWQLVSRLEGIDATESGQHVLSTPIILFHKGKLTQSGSEGWDKFNTVDEGESTKVDASAFINDSFNVPIEEFFHLLQERQKPPTSKFQAECYKTTSMISASIANDAEDELLERKLKEQHGPKMSTKNVQYSGRARAVVIVDQLRLLWILPVRDGIVLLVGDVLEQLARRRARLLRQRSLTSFRDDDSIANSVVSSTTYDTGVPVKAKTTAAELPLEHIVHTVDHSGSCFNMLEWLEKRPKKAETPISKIETEPYVKRTLYTPQSSASKLGIQVDTCSSRLVNETSMDPATPTSSGVTATDSGLKNVNSSPLRGGHVKIGKKDSVIDYEVQLISPQVKLHGAKSSLILLVYRASAKSITLKTLVSARQNQHEEGGAQQTHNEPASRSPAPTVDESTLFSTALDGDQGTPSPLPATPILLPDSLDNVTHELPASSFSRNGPIVLRQKSINVKLQGAWVYSLPEAAHGLSEWADEYEEDDEDIDIESSLNLTQQTSVLRKVMRRFNLTADYRFYESMSMGEMRAIAETGTKLPMRYVNKYPCTKMLLDVPTLCLNVESEQLYQILDIVRNLLLAPPTQESLKRSQKRSNKRKKKIPVVTVREHRLGSVGKVELHTRNPNESSPTHQNGVGTGNEKHKAQKNKAGLQVVSRHDRHTMRHGIENFISAFQTGTLYPGGRVITEVVRVEYYIGRCTCRLMMSPQYILSEGITDKVEVGMTGFGAKHSYMSVSNAAVYQDVVMQVERFWINNLTPGPEACENFEDASSILGSVLPDQDTCQRCGLQFLPDQNRLKSCRFHGFEDGSQGAFVCEKGYSAPHWTCCGEAEKYAPGCVTRPHTPKELMLCVRAEGFPPVLVEDMDIHVFKHVEVNMFPSAKYSLVLQLTRGVARMLQRYFELDEEKDGLEEENEMQITVIGDVSDLPLTRGQQQQPPSRNAKKKGKKDDEAGGEKKEKSLPDVIYVKYARLGDINLVVSVQGFKYLRLEEYNVAVKPFVRWKKVGTGPQMLRKLIWHITRSVTKHVLKPNVFRAPAEDESKRKSFLTLPILPMRKKVLKRHTDRGKPSTSSGNSKDSSSGSRIKRMFRRLSAG